MARRAKLVKYGALDSTRRLMAAAHRFTAG
jgi:hypothetical protein